MLHVKGGQSFTECRIEWINLFTDVRRLVLGLAKRVSSQYVQTMAGVAQDHLQSVVIGITDSRLVGIAAEVRSQWTARAVINLVRRSDVGTIFAAGTARELSQCEI